MKYIEEIKPGKCFKYLNDYYLATSDFNNRRKRLCIHFGDGNIRWMKFDKSVEEISIYTIDENNNFTPISQEPTDVSIKTKNIH